MSKRIPESNNARNFRVTLPEKRGEGGTGIGGEGAGGGRRVRGERFRIT
jgi:hypothetical protein